MNRAFGVAAAVLSFMMMATLLAEEPVKADAPPNGNEMPLQVYQKFKGHFDGLYGSKAGLLPGVQPLDKNEIEKELKSDAASNKAVLLKALSSSQALQRELAARALEYCGDKTAAVEALSKSVSDDTDESVRRAAAAALAKMPDAAAQDGLIKALGDSVDAVRALSARALGNIKDTHSTEALLRTLNNDTVPMVRMQAAMALKKIKDPAALDTLKKALDSEKDENVKVAIAGAVRELIGNSAEVADIPSAEQAGGTLTKLASDMKAVEEKLRGDRHDQAVQVAGAEIEKKLQQLIEKLEKG
ncbi:MAG: HEAT repeat domain-containing protein [Planctomycetota bacterium]